MSLPDRSANFRGAQALGAVAPVVGLSLHLSQPLRALRLQQDLDALAAADLNADEADDAKRALLADFAASERSQLNWFAYAGPLFLHTSLALATWLLLDEPVEAIITLGSGVVLSLTQLWTAPRSASRALARQALVPGIAPLASQDAWGVALVW